MNNVRDKHLSDDEMREVDKIRSHTGVSRPLSNAIIDNIMRLVANGLTEKEACQYSRVPLSTFRRAKEQDPDIAELFEMSLAKFKLFHIQNVAQHSQRDWKASAWLLERKFPEQFGRHVKMHVDTGKKQPSWFGKSLDVEDAQVVEDVKDMAKTSPTKTDKLLKENDHRGG